MSLVRKLATRIAANKAAKWLGDNKTYKLVIVGILVAAGIALDVPLPAEELTDPKALTAYGLLIVAALRAAIKKSGPG